MINVGDKIKIIRPYSVFLGCVVTVQRVGSAGRLFCTIPERPQGECIVKYDDEGTDWVSVEGEDDEGD